jgi:hypothetical protein
MPIFCILEEMQRCSDLISPEARILWANLCDVLERAYMLLFELDGLVS